MAALAPTWGFALIFLFMTVESSFIPFPSEIVMIPAGFLAYRHELTTGHPVADLILACLCGLTGSLAGAYVNYALSAWLGEPFLRKFGKYFFLKPEALDRAEEVFNRYGDMTTFVCRLIPVIRQLISIPAGLSRMPLGRFTLFTGLGAGIWTVILGVIGWMLAHGAGDITYRDLVYKGKEMVNAHLLPIIVLAFVFAALYILVHKWVMGRQAKK
ncbi:MAG: DedA family protein [Kiritimatiellae bacterium]|nr:DedA family protein [Kiritimatiellia bacterium]